MKQKKNFKLKLNKTTIVDLSNLEMNALLGGLSGATDTGESMRLQTMCNECQGITTDLTAYGWTCDPNCPTSF